jgi:acyl-CoA synthetase (AMP-forming)/AMP-acid ligase II
VPPPPISANISRHLFERAALQPSQAALKIPRGRTPKGEIDYLTLTFRELAFEVDAWAQRFTRAGIKPGDRTLVMVRPGLPLIAASFALFRIRAVPVIIDPGMGLRNFLAAVKQSQPKALVGISVARWLSRFARRAFATVKLRIPASGSLTARLSRPGSGAPAEKLAAVMSFTGPRELAAILFTSGSTGAPKGVCYEHGMFEAQVKMIREAYAIQPGEIDLPLLPIFALFNPALGMTTIVPEMDPKKPAAIEAAKMVQAIRQENVTNSFGSPTLWRKIGGYCVDQSITLPSLRRVLCAGASVPPSLWESARTWMPNGELHSPYGATEALPVSTVSEKEIRDLHGAGACVGRPLPQNTVKIIAMSDRPIATTADMQELPPDQIGEIIVTGPSVTKTYDAAPEATAAAKISDPVERKIWHRMGDCGYFDGEGRLWFCGRKVERVETSEGPLFTEPCERVFRANPSVKRCALIGLGAPGNQRPAIVVETHLTRDLERKVLAEALRVTALSHFATRRISRFYFRTRFPVDVRHNAKIHRLTLARWAVQARAYDTVR